MNDGFKHILVPLDGSELAEAVLPVVRLLAGSMGAAVTLLHIVEERAPATRHGQPHLTNEQNAAGYLDSIAQRLGDNVSHVEVEQHVHGTEEQDVAASIARHAGELGADLIALCTHGRNDPKRVVFGSMAQQVLKRVMVPVLLVRPEGPPVESISAILVPLDGSPDGEAALPIASSIARSCRSMLYLVRVVATAGTVTGNTSASARLLPLATEAALNVEELQAQEYLASCISQLARAGVRAEARIRRGDRPQELAEAAQERRVDLTVIATHGRAGLNALWLGSVTAGLINKLKQPVLLVRLPD